MKHLFARLVIVGLFASVANQAWAQIPQPSTTPLGSGFEIGSGATFTPNPSSMNNVVGAPGVPAGGWSTWTYSDYIGFNGTVANPSKLALGTTVPVGNLNAGQNVAALNWDSTQSYSWKIISAANSSSFIALNTQGTPIIFDTLANKTTYEAQLNNVFKFDSTKWIDSAPGTSGSIINVPTTGVFTYSIGDFNTGFGFSSISLNYTPTPEPGTILALTAFGGLALARFRRRLSS